SGVWVLERIERRPLPGGAIGRPYGLPALVMAGRAVRENSVAALRQTTRTDFPRPAMPSLRPQRRLPARADAQCLRWRGAVKTAPVVLSGRHGGSCCDLAVRNMSSRTLLYRVVP